MHYSPTAHTKFKEGYNCAQSVLFCYAPKLNLPSDMALKLATGFGAGMGRKQEVCGALSGGILVLGLLYGRGESDPKQHQSTTYLKVAELLECFQAKHQSVNCRELLSGCDLSTTQGQTSFQSDCLIERCYSYVDTVVQILDKMNINGEAC